VRRDGDAAPPSAPATSWAAIIATTLTLATSSFAVLTLPAIAPEVAERLSLPVSIIGYQISILYAGAMFASLFAGPPVNRWGACRVTQASLLITGAGCLLLTVPSVPVMIGASFFVGIAYGMTNPAASHLLARFVRGRHRNLIFSLKQTGVPLGGMVAGAVAPFMALTFGWQWAIATVAAGALALMAALGPYRAGWDDDRRPEAGPGANPLIGLRLIWSSLPLRWLAVTGFCFSFSQLCLMTFLVTLLVEELRFSLVEAGILLSAVFISGVIGRVFWGWVADRAGDGLAVIAVLGVIAAAAALATMAVTATWPVLAIEALFIAFGFTIIGWNGVFMAEAAQLCPPDKVGVAAGSILSVVFSGILLGPALFTTVYLGVGSYAFTFGLLSILCAVGAWTANLARLARRPLIP